MVVEVGGGRGRIGQQPASQDTGSGAGVEEGGGGSQAEVGYRR